MFLKFRFFAALFFCYHLLAIAAINFPAESNLRETLLRPFWNYFRISAQWQGWDMFDTKPNDAEFEIEAFVVDANNKEQKIGPLIPGLKEFHPTLKLTSLFYRLYPGAENSDRQWGTYSARLCQAAVAAQKARGLNAPPYKIFVDFISYRIRSLEDIRRDAVMSEKTVTSRGPVACDPTL